MELDKTIHIESFDLNSGATKTSSRSTRYSNDIISLRPDDSDVDFDGMTIEQASIALDLGLDELWSKVKSGQLLARTVAGEVRVYSSVESSNLDIAKLANLPAPPQEEEPVDPTVIVATMTHGSDDQIERSSSSQRELATFVHHLNLAKEENREILKLTSESMSRLTQMTDAVINMKDELITAREAQLLELQLEFKAQEEQIRSLLREKENLETLAKNILQ